LWPASDPSTQLIVEGFYDAILRKPDTGNGVWRKAQALREAALAVRACTVAELTAHSDAAIAPFVRDLARDRSLKESESPFSSVRHWAPFVLIGDWG